MTTGTPGGTAAGRDRRVVLAGAVILAVLAGAAGVALAPLARGYALYWGHLPVSGHIQGHGTDMPPAAVVCANCHEPAATAGATAPRPIARLDAAALTTPKSRRGGPQTVFTEADFCSFLETGIDPSMTLVDRTMPRFTLAAGDCAALWSYLSRR